MLGLALYGVVFACVCHFTGQLKADMQSQDRRQTFSFIMSSWRSQTGRTVSTPSCASRSLACQHDFMGGLKASPHIILLQQDCPPSTPQLTVVSAYLHSTDRQDGTAMLGFETLRQESTNSHCNKKARSTQTQTMSQQVVACLRQQWTTMCNYALVVPGSFRWFLLCRRMLWVLSFRFREVRPEHIVTGLHIRLRFLLPSPTKTLSPEETVKP